MLKPVTRETDKLLFGVFTHFFSGVTKSKRNNEYPIEIFGIV